MPSPKRTSGRKSRRKSKRAEIALSTVGAASALGFGVLTSKTLAPRTIFHDIKLRSLIPRYGKKSKKVAFQFGYLGKEWAVLPAAAAVAIKLLLEDRDTGAIAVVAGTLAAIGASHIFDVALPQKTPPPGRHAPRSPHYPSGHALHSATTLGIGSWVLAREGFAERKAIAAGATALAVALGFDRLIQDRHWTSDVVGGWLAALSLAALTAAAYERFNREGSSPRRARRKSAA
jgi:membrane-associated phospholipid phosphatase